MVMVSFECIVSLSKVRINKYFFMITKTGTLGVPGDCDNPALVEAFCDFQYCSDETRLFANFDIF